MKLILTSFLFLFAVVTTFAQTPDKVIARVRYTYINKNDTIWKGKTRAENMLLFLGKSASFYTSYDQINHQLALDQKYKAKAMSLIDDGKPKVVTIDDRGNDWMSNESHFYFFKENKHFLREYIPYQAYLVEENTPTINWKITKDTVSFSGVHCQKALATIGGKDWTAWFAPHLPFQSGPWLLNGLPGLIIDAYNNDKNIHFQFSGIENANDGDYKRIDDITKRPNASAGDVNAIDIMLGLDIASAYFSNTIKLAIDAPRATKEELAKFKKAIEKDKKGVLKTQSKF